MKKNKMMMKKPLRSLMANAIIISLVQSSMLSIAHADVTASDIEGVSSTVLQGMKQYYDVRAQIRNNEMATNAMMAQQAKMQTMIPTPGPAKFFPECKIAPSMSNFPANVCSSISVNPQEIGNMMAYENLAVSWTNYYDQNLNEASNAAVPSGLACLNSKQKAMDSQLTEMVNSLQRLQDRLNQDKQIFRDNNKRLLEEMTTANDELFGASGKNNLELKTRDFSKYFSQSCQAVLGKENLKNGSSVGLNGILQGISGTNKAANEFSLNKGTIEEDIRREAQRISNDIKNRGVADFMAGPTILNEIAAGKYKNIATIAGKQIQDMQTAKVRIIKELAELGYSPPEMDKNFTADMDEFMAGAEDFFKKKYVNDCVTGNDKGLGLTVDQILQSISQKNNERSRNISGSAADKYRKELKSILDGDDMMDAKLQKIDQLNKIYPDIQMKYNGNGRLQVSESPYAYLQKVIAACEQRFGQDDTFTSKGSKGVSYQKKVERGRGALQELKNLNDSFSSKINAAVIGQMLSCNGESYKPGEGACTEDTMNPSGASFCVSHASQCANQIQGCYAEANAQVQQRKTKMQNLAKQYNANVAAMIARANQLYEQQKVAVTNITQLIQQKFPGTNFEIPKDMFVGMPEMSKDAFGIELAGNGDLKFLEGENSLPGKIDKLKKIFQQQRESVKNTITEYIALQKAAMEKERGRWEKLTSDCKGHIDGSQKEVAKMDAENKKRQAKEDAETRKFCKKYDSISQNPLGACGKAKDLAELSDAVSARIHPRALDLTEQFASACDGYMNETQDLPSYCDGEETGSKKAECNALRNKRARDLNASANSKEKTDKPNPGNVLKKLCNGNKSDEDFIKKAAGFLSKKNAESISETKNVSDAADKFSDGEDGYFFSTLKDDILPKLDGSTVCAKLKSVDDVKVKEKEEAIASAKAKLEEAKKIEIPSDSNSSGDAKKIAEHSKAEKDKKIAEAESALKAANEDLDSLKNTKALKEKIDDALISLATVDQPVDPDTKEAKVSELKNIGSRIGEQSRAMCDLQSNSTIAKTPGMFDLPAGFDNKVLGKSGFEK